MLKTLLLLAVLLLSSAQAQTLRDKVKKHVTEQLEKPKDEEVKDGSKDKKKNKKKDGAQDEEPAAGDPDAGTAHKNGGSDTETARKNEGPHAQAAQQEKDGTKTLTVDDLLGEPEPKGPALPIRVFGDKYRFDVKADSGFRGWVPQQYESAAVDVAGYFTWSVEARAKIRFLNLHQGYYESNGLEAPRNEQASVAAEVGRHIPKAAWAMAMIGIPIFRRWEPIIRYEARAFNTTATPKAPVCIVSRDTSADLVDCLPTTERLRVISAYETFVVGVQHNPPGGGTLIGGHRGNVPPFYVGAGYVSYNKPYQVTIDGNTLTEYLFDGRFRGAGLAGGVRVGGRVGRPFGHVNLQVGLGQVSLADDLTLNELAPEGWLIAYLQGDVGIGYRFALIDGPPALLLNLMGTGGGASFHFVDTSSGDDGESLSVNWDFLWSARAALELAF